MFQIEIHIDKLIEFSHNPPLGIYYEPYALKNDKDPIIIVLLKEETSFKMNIKFTIKYLIIISIGILSIYTR